jgi:hypothetical protein
MIKKLSGGQSRYEARGWASGHQFRRRFRTRKAAEEFMRAVAMREERRKNGSRPVAWCSWASDGAG